MAKLGTAAMAALVLAGTTTAAMAGGAKYRAESQEADALKAWAVMGEFCDIAK